MKYELTDEGREYLNQGLPENNLVRMLRERGRMKLADAKNSVNNFSVALNWAKKNNWIFIENGYIRAVADVSSALEDSLESISKGNEDGLVNVLLKRNLIREMKDDVLKRANEYVGKEIGIIPSELIKTGLWRKTKLKPYNVESVGKKVNPGKKHVLTLYKDKIRKVFLDMGFTESDGPMLESGFWNFDTLFIPQDHPSREMQDTFYMKKPVITKIPKDIVDKVKTMHEKGDENSTGWGYSWSNDMASQPILRTHTTSVSARFLKNNKPPLKMFCIGRVFRNETVDFKHLAEFTQIEGIVADENLNFRNLLGYLKEFYSRMGFDKVRFRPAYFPYTEMSVEPEVWMEDRGEWLEMGGAGIFREEVTKPLGIDVPVLAWGLGLERLPLLKLGIKDIRNFYYKNDLKLLRGASVWQ